VSAISNNIEAFINSLFAQGERVEVRRNELAQSLGCAPSQINYVLSTRFTLERGYIISSRRGGGGCISIVRVQARQKDLCILAEETIGAAISRIKAQGIIDYLRRSGLVAPREAALMDSAARDIPGLEAGAQDRVRAQVMRQMVLALAGSGASE
jgi:transcriptional regulator CtsR